MFGGGGGVYIFRPGCSKQKLLVEDWIRKYSQNQFQNILLNYCGFSQFFSKNGSTFFKGLRKYNVLLTLRAPNKNCSRCHFIFLLSFKENKA